MTDAPSPAVRAPSSTATAMSAAARDRPRAPLSASTRRQRQCRDRDARPRWRTVHAARLHRHDRRRLLRRLRQPGAAAAASRPAMIKRQFLPPPRSRRSPEAPAACSRPRSARSGLRRWFQDHQTGALGFPAAPVGSTRRWTHPGSAGAGDRRRPGDHEKSAGSGGETELPELRVARSVGLATDSRDEPKASARSAATPSPSPQS